MPSEILVSSRLLITFQIHETRREKNPDFMIYVGYLLYCAPEYQKAERLCSWSFVRLLEEGSSGGTI